MVAPSAISSKKGKQVIIPLSSSSSSSEGEGEESESESGSEEETDEDDQDEIFSDNDDDDDDAAEGDDDYDDDDGDEDDTSPEGNPCSEDVYKKVIDLLQRRRSLHSLKLEECRAYLRKHELRVTGTKAACIQRILEHWRIKDGNAEKLYPESSFVINCTGDVCKGDVILFKQRVYEKFDIVKRGGGGKIIGKRVIAGRVVKESYGAAKQQHTFTVETLWSKGAKALPPLHPLLVKGRNLYRLKTFRQTWSNEAERLRVLSEKHERGAKARHTRALAKAKSTNRCSRKISSTNRAPHQERKTEMHKRKVESELTRPMKKQKSHAVRTSEPGSKKNSSPNRSMKKQKSDGVRTPSHDLLRKQRVAETRYSGPLTAHPERSNYYQNGIHTQYQLPHRVPQYAHNQAAFERNNVPASHHGYGMFHPPRYSTGHTSSAGGPTYQHMNRGNYINNPYVNSGFGNHIRNQYVNSAFHYDSTRRVFDDGVSGVRYFGWTGP